MSVTREQVMAALQAQITNGIAAGFSGNTTANNPAITGIASTEALFAGLPVVGGTVPAGSVIQSIDSASQVTVTIAPTGAGMAVSFLTGFRTVGRRVLPWSQVTAQPALFLINADEEREVRSGQPPRRTMMVELLVYSDAGKNVDFAPGIALNNFADAIDGALQPDNVQLNRLTLGGLVQHCWIEGKTEFYPGDLGPQAKALIPVKILIP